MPTPYEVIYKRFRLNKIKDFDDLHLSNEEIQENDFEFLKGARSKFKNCKNVKEYDDLLLQFPNTLTDEEIDILATLMILEWLSPKIATTELIKQALSSKDFQLTSQANQLKQLMDLRKMYKTEVNQMISSYSYNNLIDKL